MTCTHNPTSVDVLTHLRLRDGYLTVYSRSRAVEGISYPSDGRAKAAAERHYGPLRWTLDNRGNAVATLY